MENLTSKEVVFELSRNISDCSGEAHSLRFFILENGNIEVRMFEELDDCPSIIPCNCLADIDMFRKACWYEALMEVSGDKVSDKIAEDMIVEVYNKHKDMFPNLVFMPNGLDNYMRTNTEGIMSDFENFAKSYGYK